MRYDNLLRNLQKAADRYEATVRTLLNTAAARDADTRTKLTAGVKKHWTQRPENRKKVAQIQRKMQAAKSK